MFDYTLAQDAQTQTGILWDPNPLSPLAPGILTPFSHSVLSEIIRRGWFTYYDRLGFEPTPGAQLVRSQLGRAYLNISLSAQLDATHAAVEPPAVRIEGVTHAAAPWEKPGLLGGLRARRSQRAIRLLLDELDDQIGGVIQRARNWHTKTQDMRWTQAEILQVMEEIERISVESATAFFAARHNLEGTVNRLLWAMQERAPFPQSLGRIQQLWSSQAFDPAHALVESALIDALWHLADVWQQTQAQGDDGQAGLDQVQFTNWRTMLPEGPFRTAFADFSAHFGHRALAEGEIAQPRWSDDPTAVVRSVVLFAASGQPAQRQRHSAEQAHQQVLEVVTADQQKSARQWLEQLPDLMRLQSRALQALAYVLAGTRQWAVAAAREAMADHRLTTEDDIFFYELEEVKEMMTGEWNISATAEIQAEAAQRKARFAEFQRERPPDLLLDNAAARIRQPIHGGAPERVAGPVTHLPIRDSDSLTTTFDSNAILRVPAFDSGCALLLPLAAGFIADYGAPLDPVAAAACIWKKPLVLGVGAPEIAGRESRQVTVDGASATLTPGA